VVCGIVFGGAQVIKGFDTAVTGLAVGQTNKVRVTPEDAYGQVGRRRLVEAAVIAAAAAALQKY
jgi:FKBP-type peptidyl-prolyl cis-trans isomerase 2